MPIVSIFSGDYCHADEVASGVACEIGCPLLGGDILVGAAARHHVAASDLARAMVGPPFAFDRVTHKRKRCLSIIADALAGALADDVVCTGPAVLMIPKGIGHVLRVCLLADPGYRAEAAVKARGVSIDEARRIIKDADVGLAGWTQHLLNASPWDKALYDIKIPMNTTTVEAAMRLIAENARKEAIAPTPESCRALEEFRVEARAGLALARAGLYHKVECSAENLTVVVDEYVLRMDRLERDVKEILAEVAGPRAVKVRAGANYRPSAVFAPVDIEMPSKVLLVDDEKDFVLTLSERLEMRDIAPAVAYDGEQALDILKEEEPEVIVLDLKMPGIDGIEVLRKVKTEHPAVEVIILTGHGSDKDRDLCLRLGAFAYLEKPVDIETLSRTMKRAYDKIRSGGRDGGAASAS